MYRKHKYLTPLPFIFSTVIREYDIEKANINILYQHGMLSKQQYEYYYHADRMTRQIDIGLMIKKNKEVGDTIKNGITKSKQLFLETNGLNEGNIISIKNDAIFIVNTIPNHTSFDNINFKLKNIYTSFMVIDRIEYYYNYNMMTGDDYLHIKGISEDKIPLHDEYILDFIKYILSLVQTSDLVECINTLQNFYNQYINLQLDPGYYRTFDRFSKFMIGSNNIVATSDSISKDDLKYINISCNRIILETLYSYLTSLYFSKTK